MDHYLEGEPNKVITFNSANRSRSSHVQYDKRFLKPVVNFLLYIPPANEIQDHLLREFEEMEGTIHILSPIITI